LDDLKRQLRQLSASQRAEVRAYLAGLEALGSDPTAQALSGGHLWTFFIEQCVRLGLGSYMPKAVRSAIARHSGLLEQYLDTAAPGSPQVIRRGILATGIELLHADLRRRAIPINVTVLANNLGNLPAVLDRAFPGYAKAGMLAMIIKGGPNE